MANSREKADPAETAFPRKQSPWFNSDTIGKAIANRYVAWLDLMGARNIMGRSLTNAATYIGKIHTSVLEAARDRGVEVYPVIDGCYIMAEERDDLEATLRSAMIRLASVFVHEGQLRRRFLVRGGIAAGRVVTGKDIANCSDTLRGASPYASCLAIGTAIGQAYMAEAKAPPFGFWVDITARAFRAEKKHPFNVTYWRWWRNSGDERGKERQAVLGKAVMEYFEWAERNHRSLEYELARLREHREAAQEYFDTESAFEEE